MSGKKCNRWIALLLAVVMMLSVLPGSVMAAGETAGTGDGYMKLVHLDCGRKYFTPGWIKNLIDVMAKDGYTHLELAFGNDGLRFLLDDMSVGTYESDAVKEAVKAGNVAYNNRNSYNPGTNELSQSDMDGIIAHAKEKGIEIVPLLNTPGHMDAVLFAYNSLAKTDAAYDNSNTTIALTNDGAVAFTQDLVAKYVAYFSAKGSKYFNMGADEYANDVYTTGAMGFGRLQSTKSYGNYVNYVNEMNDIIKAQGMTAIAFNDGIYFGSDVSSGTFDSDIMISYWSSGWSSYLPASARFLKDKGHKLINTHSDFYYVLGKNDNFDNGSGYAANWDNKKFSGTEFAEEQSGSMFCIWYDYPGAEEEGTINVEAALSAENADTAADEINAQSGTIAGKVIDAGVLAAMSKSMGHMPQQGQPSDGELDKRTIELVVGGTKTDTISGANYAGTYETEDPSIATVEVTGIDGTASTPKYTRATVTCNDLIAKESDSWEAASGYYYTPDGTNYYPVYAKRTTKVEGNFWEYNSYTYTWGYKIGDAEPVQIGSTQTEGTRHSDGRNQTPDITVYTQSTEPGTPASTTVTFTGVSAGTTYVTIGNVRYTINVKEDDLDDVTPLTIEYWITNRRVTANGGTSMTISADKAYGENGALFSDLVPANGLYESDPMVYWKGTRLASNNKQTTGSGVDKTRSGDDFAYVRYYNGQWQYSADREAWVAFATGDQVVAYYLQRTDVTEEVTTDVVDWGPQRGSWSDLSYLGTKYVLVDYSVKYPSGDEIPSTFPNSKSLGFHCDTETTSNGYYYRDIGMIRGVETANYEIYMITVTPTSDNPATTLASTAAGNTSYSYDTTAENCGRTEVVAWAATQEDLDNSGLGTYTSITGAHTCHIGGEPIVTGLQIYRQHGVKVTYYVRAKITKDSLTVHYLDRKAGNVEFYSYGINVIEGTTFDEGFALVNGQLVNNTVQNDLGRTQTVSQALNSMPEIGAQYRFSEYTCVEVARSEDGKDVYLYYDFNNTHNFVIDFGLPLTITSTDLGVEPAASASVSGAEYGTAVVENNTVVYTPNSVLLTTESLQLTLTVKNSQGKDEFVTHQIYIHPASNVLYEDTFLSQMDGDKAWTHTNGTTMAEQAIDQALRYGYDDAYKSSTGNSMGSAWTITDLSSGSASNYLTTTFTGNGFDLIGTAGKNTGYVYLGIQNTDTKSVKLVVIDTRFNDSTVADTLYQVPLAHEMLDEGTYTVKVRAAYAAATSGSNANAASTFSTFSVGDDAMADASLMEDVYALIADLEQDGAEVEDVKFVYFDETSPLASYDNAVMSTYAMREDAPSARTASVSHAAGTTVTIDGFRVYMNSNNESYMDSEKNVNYMNVLDAVDGGYITAYTEQGNGTWAVDTYEANGGPQNEIYLMKGQSVAFKVAAGSTVQISARAVTGATKLNDVAIESNTEMYYAVTPDARGIVMVTNEGDGMLALGNLKVQGTVVTMSDEEVNVTVPKLLSAMYSAPVEPEEPEVFAPGKLTLHTTSLRLFTRKTVTLTVNASSDVDYITVNGRRYYAINDALVNRGLGRTKIFTVTVTVPRNQTARFEVVAFNAAGVASETYYKQG